ncbi:hypothetical protein V8B55DRAFT_1440258 [Mucor lusitanicus]
MVSIFDWISFPLYIQLACDDTEGHALTDNDAKDLAKWIETTLVDEVVKGVDVSRCLASFPAIVLENESPAMRKMMQMMRMEESPSTPTVLEINPDHPVMKGLFNIRNQNLDLAKLVTEKIYDNALCAAGVLDDPRSMITRLNKLLEITVNTVDQDKKIKALNNHVE